MHVKRSDLGACAAALLVAASALAGVVTALPAGAQVAVFNENYPACQQATTNCQNGNTQNIQIGSDWSTIIFTVVGGNGGEGGPTGGSAGGEGAQVVATWDVSNLQGSWFQVNVGAAGGPGEPNGNNPPYGLAGANGLGGAAGGGTGGDGQDDHAGGGGGGSSDVRTCTDNSCVSATLGTRIIVAGGGGGGGNSKDGGAGGVGGDGGQPSGTAGTASTPSNCGGGQGGTSSGGGNGAVGAGGSRCVGGSNGAQGPTAPGAAGASGGDTSSTHGYAGGGGGGGLFGGGGGAGAQTPAANDSGGGGGGGGGSSYVAPSLTNPAFSLNSPTSTGFGGNGSIQVIAYGSTPGPDAKIRVGDTGPYTGAGQLAPTPQEQTAEVPPGGTATFEVAVDNHLPSAARFKVTGTASQQGFIASYRDGTNDVTNAVTAAAYTTPSLAPGATHKLVLAVKAPPSGRNTATFVVRFSAETDLNRFDEVQAKVSGGSALVRTGSSSAALATLGAFLFAVGLTVWLLARSRPRRWGR
ncbi:MAG: Glycine rich protein [Actinomycetota bacterium]|nr:Glycine rich protein [Actinomycetota bacterium]